MELEKITSLDLSADILQLIGELDAFSGAWRALGNMAPEVLTQMRHVATVESIGSSTRIEGSKLSDHEVEGILRNIKIQSFKSRDVQEVAGYGDVMNIVFANYQDMPLSESFVQYMHKVMLQYSEKDEWHRGKYKIHSNSVVATDGDGKHMGVVFETTSPMETPFQMRELLDWTSRQLEATYIHPLVVIAVFVVVFLAIHPFQDGNGRLSRVLTTFLLLKAGYMYVPYSSLESVIEAQKQDYYVNLRATQGTLSSFRPEWSPWVTFFLKALKRQKDNLEAKVTMHHRLLAELPPISQAILQIVRGKGTITIGELEKLTDYNRNTMKKHLINLVHANYLQQNGKGKGTWYTLKVIADNKIV